MTAHPHDLTTGQWLRAAVQRVSCGSGRLCWLIARRIVGRGAERARAWWAGVTGWLAEAAGLAWLLRLGLLVGAGLVARKVLLAVGRSLGHAHGPEWLMWVFTAVWIIAAYRVGHPDWRPKPRPPEAKAEAEPEPEKETAEDGEEPGSREEQPETAAEQVPAGPPLPILPDLRIALARVGTPHAHLAVLAADLGTTPERVREALEKWQIPIEAVRMQGRGTSTGVKGGPAAHPSLALRPEDAAVVAAGQPANNNDNNGGGGLIVERPVEGMTIIRDPAETARRRHAV
ncbi:hypothetical protein [Streptomyces sp. NPDC005970]|uniref:hypothetical protein n=1 Tax=Streptomyces sp. NPDC005970 TaxID=3156723 RepID=UPI0033DB0132